MCQNKCKCSIKIEGELATIHGLPTDQSLGLWMKRFEQKGMTDSSEGGLHID